MALGTWLSVSVSVPAWGVESSADRMYWDGESTNTSFALKVPRETKTGRYVGIAEITAGPVPVAILHFEVKVDAIETQVESVGSQARWVKTIFASYASEDRAEVLRWARGAEAVGVEVFIDVVALRAGVDWEQELFRKVPSCDLFSLFWSEPASRSSWVETEWRCALASRGLSYIHPVTLVDPRVVPPPAELAAKHFNDPKRMLIDYESGFRG